MQYQSELDHPVENEVKPLTRYRPNGERLTRFAEVETEIQQFVRTGLSQWLLKLEIKDNTQPGYTSEECLVYVLRDSLEKGNKELSETVTEVLYYRVKKQISSYARRYVPTEYFEEAVSDMLGDLFMKICNLKSDSSDFSQVRFGLFLRRICSEIWERYQSHEKINKQTDFIDQTGEDEKTLEIESISNKYSSIDQLDAKKGLDVLPEPIKTAFILRYYKDWQIESIDPSIPTLSQYFGKTEKTIRNWLNRAEELLSKWREAETQ